jgi:hypothetical protein
MIQGCYPDSIHASSFLLALLCLKVIGGVSARRVSRHAGTHISSAAQPLGCVPIQWTEPPVISPTLSCPSQLSESPTPRRLTGDNGPTPLAHNLDPVLDKIDLLSRPSMSPATRPPNTIA